MSRGLRLAKPGAAAGSEPLLRRAAQTVAPIIQHHFQMALALSGS
jgi:hypothetical protein